MVCHVTIVNYFVGVQVIGIFLLGSIMVYHFSLFSFVYCRIWKTKLSLNLEICDICQMVAALLNVDLETTVDNGNHVHQIVSMADKQANTDLF